MTLELKDSVRLLYGHTITWVDVWEDESGQGASITLTLGNGEKITISSWGHDWWGLNVEVD